MHYPPPRSFLHAHYQPNPPDPDLSQTDTAIESKPTMSRYKCEVCGKRCKKPGGLARHYATCRSRNSQEWDDKLDVAMRSLPDEPEPESDIVNGQALTDFLERVRASTDLRVPPMHLNDILDTIAEDTADHNRPDHHTPDHDTNMEQPDVCEVYDAAPEFRLPMNVNRPGASSSIGGASKTSSTRQSLMTGSANTTDEQYPMIDGYTAGMALPGCNEKPPGYS